MVLHNLLRHSCSVRITHWNHSDHVVIRLLGTARTLDGLVVVLFRRVVSNDGLEQLELLAHRVVHASLHRPHHFQSALKDGQCCTYRCLRTHITDVHVPCGCKLSAFLHNVLEQCVQNLAWFFVRQRQDVVAYRARRNIYVPELSRCDRCVVALNAKTARLETARKIRKRTSINKLANKHSGRLSVATNKVNETISIEAKPRNVLIVNKVLTLGVESVPLVPITSYGQNLSRGLFYRHNVRQRDASLLAILVLVLVALEVKIDVHLQHTVAIILECRHAHLLGLLLLDVVELMRRITQVHVHIEPSFLQLGDLILCLTHHVRDPLGTLQTGCTVGHNDVFCGDEHRNLTANARVVVDLLERRASQGQVPQQLLMLWPVLSHHFSELVVHVFTNSCRCFFFGGCIFAQNLCLHRACGWERLHDAFGLEAHNGLCQHGVKHTTRALPRLRTIFVLQAQQLQAVYIRMNPLFAVTDVFGKVLHELTAQRVQCTGVHELSQVLVKVPF